MPASRKHFALAGYLYKDAAGAAERVERIASALNSDDPPQKDWRDALGSLSPAIAPLRVEAQHDA